MPKYVLGVDYGSDSCRATLVNTENGHEYDSEVFFYPRWEKGLYCDPKISQYRQHPLDHIEGLEATIGAITKRTDKDIVNSIVAISVDTTGSTPCAVDENGVPLALLPEFAENPNAMFVLWKDHTSIKEAEQITKTARTWGGVDYTKYIGGIYSAEWYFAKALHIIREDEAVRKAAYSWVENCDWLPALLTGVKSAKDIMRSRCSAGHKAMWNDEFGGLPSNDFFKAIDPLFDGLRDRLFEETYTLDTCAGVVTEEWQKKLGLPDGVKVGVGAFDAHMGAVGGNIVPKSLVRIIGTSTCDILIADYKTMDNVLVAGICGQVDGSVFPGMIGLEAGQSAYGDVFAWFRRLVTWSFKHIPSYRLSEDEKKQIEKKILFDLETEAREIDPKISRTLALDWLNGRRTPYANQNLEGGIMGISLGTDAPQIYRSLLEATAYGARAIVERFEDSGLEIDEIIAIGGVARKSPLSMQISADVLNKPVKVCESEQCVALGAAIFAAVVGGVYSDVKTAQTHMASKFEAVYMPRAEYVAVYDKLYKKYLAFGKFEEGK